MSESESKPKFFNERISKEKLLEGARKVRVASMDTPPRKKILRKRKEDSHGLWSVLTSEFARPDMAAAGLFLAGMALVLSAAFVLHVYDVQQGGDGLVFLNLMIEAMPD